jgi:hypothetical protein
MILPAAIVLSTARDDEGLTDLHRETGKKTTTAKRYFVKKEEERKRSVFIDLFTIGKVHFSICFLSFALISDLRKEFEVPPYSQKVELGSQIELRCHPPDGKPKPRVSRFICMSVFAD